MLHPQLNQNKKLNQLLKIKMQCKQSLFHTHIKLQQIAHTIALLWFTNKSRAKECQLHGFLILTMYTPIASHPTLKGCIAYEETTIYILYR
jgi:hypothetical protein